MGQCVNCDKSGMFISVDKYGLCQKCAKSINGMIRYYELIPLWLTLSQEERNKCIEIYDNTDISTNSNSSGLLKGTVSMASGTKSAFLSAIGYNLISKKEYELSEKLLLEAERVCENIIDLHYIYNHIIELTYKQRELLKCMNMCVHYCIKDINMYPKLIKAWQKEAKEYEKMNAKRLAETKSPALKKHYEKMGKSHKQRIDDGLYTKTYIPSFERLAIICEKRGDIIEAIGVCELAIKYNLTSNTKMGFEGRLEKLKKKIEETS